MSRYSRWVLLGAVTAGVGLWPVAGVLAAEGGDARKTTGTKQPGQIYFPVLFDNIFGLQHFGDIS